MKINVINSNGYSNLVEVDPKLIHSTIKSGSNVKFPATIFFLGGCHITFDKLEELEELIKGLQAIHDIVAKDI